MDLKMNWSKVLILSVLWSFCNVLAKTGEEIADILYQHPTECGDPSDGGIWAPLQGENPDCGGKQCTVPQQWCSAKSVANQETPTLNCVNVPAACQPFLQDSATAATTAATDTPPTVAPDTTTQVTTTIATTTTRATTLRTTQATTAAPVSVMTAAPSSGGCMDNNENCCFWARCQQCDANPMWMRTNCQQSCGTCGCQASQFQTCQVKVSTTCKIRLWLNGGRGLAVMGTPGGPPGVMTGSSTSGSTGFGSPSGQTPSKVTIQFGRKRRHLMPRRFNS